MRALKIANRLEILLPSERAYYTVSSFILAVAGRMLHVGQVVEVLAWRWEVVDLDGSHIDKLLVSFVRISIRSATRRQGSGLLNW